MQSDEVYLQRLALLTPDAWRAILTMAGEWWTLRRIRQTCRFMYGLTTNTAGWCPRMQAAIRLGDPGLPCDYRVYPDDGKEVADSTRVPCGEVEAPGHTWLPETVIVMLKPRGNPLKYQQTHVPWRACRACYHVSHRPDDHGVEWTNTHDMFRCQACKQHTNICGIFILQHTWCFYAPTTQMMDGSCCFPPYKAPALLGFICNDPLLLLDAELPREVDGFKIGVHLDEKD